MEKVYSVGRLFSPTKEDEHFEDYEEAEVKAIENSIDDDVWAVRDEETGNVESIAYQGYIYSQ